MVSSGTDSEKDLLPLTANGKSSRGHDHTTVWDTHKRPFPVSRDLFLHSVHGRCADRMQGSQANTGVYLLAHVADMMVADLQVFQLPMTKWCWPLEERASLNRSGVHGRAKMPLHLPLGASGRTFSVAFRMLQCLASLLALKRMKVPFPHST